VVPESLKVQDAPTEEPEQQQGKGNEDDNDEEYPPLSDSENEKWYHDADESESYRVEALVPISRPQALLVHMGISTTPKYQIKRVPRLW
jgi:hypothetical protein